MLPLNEVQAALFVALTAALQPVPVYDEPPKNSPFPYATIGAAIATPSDTLTEWGTDIEATIHVWSRQNGTRECNALMAATKAALDGQRLPVTGFQWVDTRFVMSQPLTELDGVTRHGIVTFRVITFQ